MTEQAKKYVISILIDNEFGALARVVELFSARGYNIESLTVAPVTSDKKISRINITTIGTQKTINLICKLLCRIVPVHRAVELTQESDYIERELVLIKIIGDDKRHKAALEFVEEYKPKTVDVTDSALIFEISGSFEEIENALAQLSQIKPDSISRTGVAAGFKGPKTIKEEIN